MIWKLKVAICPFCPNKVISAWPPRLILIMNLRVGVEVIKLSSIRFRNPMVVNARRLIGKSLRMVESCRFLMPRWRHLNSVCGCLCVCVSVSGCVCVCVCVCLAVCMFLIFYRPVPQWGLNYWKSKNLKYFTKINK